MLLPVMYSGIKRFFVFMSIVTSIEIRTANRGMNARDTWSVAHAQIAPRCAHVTAINNRMRYRVSIRWNAIKDISNQKYQGYPPGFQKYIFRSIYSSNSFDFYLFIFIDLTLK